MLAGEASGDKQAALLCAAIFKGDKNAIIKGWGGEDMISCGVEVTKHYSELAYMGFVEVVKHLPAIFRNFKTCKKEILSMNPDALILIDYPGFNLRMASWAYTNKIPVYYYISPQLWAWHTSRVHKIKEAVRRMYVILPFEKAFYANYGVDALYIGHPLAIAIRNKFYGSIAFTKGQIALLPGSRKHEIELLLPIMVEVARQAPQLLFEVVAVNHLSAELYQDIIGNQKNIQIVHNQMYEVLQRSEAAIVTSGTATLETALIGTPQIVVYKGNAFSYQIAKRLIKVPFISLVNLIAGRKLVPELIQNDCTAESILENLLNILQPDSYATIRDGYKSLTEQLTSGGGPDAAAVDIISDIQIFKRK